MKRAELRLEASGWRLYRADGSEADISTSATCGLQEAFNLLAGDATELLVLGGGVMPCSTPIYMPVLHNKRVQIAPVSIAFGAGVVGDCLVFDSAMQLDFRMDGEVACSGNAVAVTLMPRTPLANDPDTGIKNSEIHFKTIMGLGPQSVCFRALTQNHGICHNRLTFNELRGGLSGFQVCETGGVEVGFFGNQIVCPHVHYQTGIGVSVGNLGTSKISDNQWDLIIAPAAGGVGLETMDKNSVYRLSVFQVEGMPSVGMRLMPQSHDNLILRGSIIGQTAINDQSGGRNRVI